MQEAKEGKRTKFPYIVFELTKIGSTGEEGEILKPSLLTEEERKNLASICHFRPHFSENYLPGVKIESYEVLFNGIASSNPEDENLSINEKEDRFEGSPTVMVRFNLNKVVDLHKFYSAVELSRLLVQPSEAAGWYFEDHNGWSRPVSAELVNDFLLWNKLPVRGKKVTWEDM